MRLIEKEMVRAAYTGRAWAKDNTTVARGENKSLVFLHGHHIASVIRDTGRLIVRPNIKTLKAWPTRTTMSRLRALGVDVCTRKGKIILNGKPLEG